MPLEPFHNNLTYAVLCTITSFEALIKGMSSNRARKQQKQSNKWFCSNPSLMFTSISSRPLRLLTSPSLLLIYLLSIFSLHTPPFKPTHPLYPSITLSLCSTTQIFFRPRSATQALWLREWPTTTWPMLLQISAAVHRLQIIKNQMHRIHAKNVCCCCRKAFYQYESNIGDVNIIKKPKKQLQY